MVSRKLVQKYVKAGRVQGGRRGSRDYSKAKIQLATGETAKVMNDGQVESHMTRDSKAVLILPK